MDCWLFNSIFRSTILSLSLLLSGPVLANENCFSFDDSNMSFNSVDATSIKTECIDKLSEGNFSKLASVLIDKREGSNYIFQTHQDDDNKIINLLILKSIKKYRNTKNKIYSSTLIRLLESQKLSALQSYFEDDCTPLNSDKINPTEKHAILYMHSLPRNKFLTLLITNDEIHIRLFETDVIKSEAKNFRAAIEGLNEVNEVTTATKDSIFYKDTIKHGIKLYDLLILPFSKIIKKHRIEHLTIIPDSIVGIFPIEALIDSHTNKNNKIYVLDKNYSISYSPNLSITNKKTNKKGSILAVSPARKGAQNSFDYDMELLENLQPNTTRVQGNKASKHGLFNAVTNKSTSILYIASHAQFEPKYEDSFILLADDKELEVKEFEKMTSSLSSRKLPPDMIVLSACETVKGEGSVDATLGLAGAAARSGVNTVVASLWKTKSPEVLIGRYTDKQDFSFFHKISIPGITKAKALQLSKRHLKKSRSIYQWSAFIIIGDWGTI